MAIVAAPVTEVADIVFDPPLPPAQQALSGIHIGAGVKIVARLPDGHAARHNTVIGGDPLWGAWRRGDRVTGFVPAHSGDAADEDSLHDYIRGCDATFAPGQVYRHTPVIAEPHGLVRFAGVERSSWPDNMEGAVHSGERAARDVLPQRTT